MTYLQKHRETYRKDNIKNYKRVAAVILLAALLSAVFYFWSGAFSSLFSKILIPASNFIAKTGSNIELALRIFEPEMSLVSQNETLKKRTAELEAKVFDYSLLSDENAFLKERLGFPIPKFAATNILLMPPHTPYDLLLIDRGKESGVFAGARVLASERSILGYVEEFYEGSSRVRMFSSPRVKTRAVFEKDGTIVELLGRGGGNFFLEAPLGFEVKEGDIFLIPGSERLAVAVAGFVKRQDTSSFVSVFLRAPLKISGNSSLFVEVE